MSNLLIGYGNYCESAILSGGSWNAALPLANLQNRLLSKVAKSTDVLAASTLVNIDLGSAKPVRALGVIKTNISATGASYRVRGSNDATFATSVTDSGILSANNQTPHLIMGLAASITARYWRLDIIDAANVAGSLQIGRLFIGDGFVPVNNVSYGASTGYRSTTNVVTSIGEVDYFDSRPLRRNSQLALDWLTDSEAQAVQSLHKSVGISGEVLVIPDLLDSTFNQQNNFLARLSQLSPLQNPYYNINKTGFDFLEIV